MCLIQLPATIAVFLIFTLGGYSSHRFSFWCVVTFGLLACWSWSITRSGQHRRYSGKIPLLFELVTPTLAIASWISTIIAIIMCLL